MRRRVNFLIKNKKILIINLAIILIYLVIFFIFFRLLKFFQQHKTLDLNIFLSKEKLLFLILVFIFLFFLRRLVVTFFKITFFKIHYFLLSPYTIGWHNLYAKIYIKFVYNPVKRVFAFLWYLNIFMSLLLIYLLLNDLLLNNLILDLSLNFLKWFGLFKFCYIIIKFIATKQDLHMDYYAYNFTYPGDILNGSFWKDFDYDLEPKAIRYKFEVIAK